VFISYLSSFFVAALLSIFYIGYVASGLFVQIREEINKEATTEITEKLPSTVSTSIFFIYDYITDIPESNPQNGFSELTVDIPVTDDGIPSRRDYSSDYFLRPPPKL
jgi:cbb3-type cytochrome oxidase subunit 3